MSLYRHPSMLPIRANSLLKAALFAALPVVWMAIGCSADSESADSESGEGDGTRTAALSTGFPVNLRGVAPQSGSATLTLQKPANATQATVKMSVFDPDNANEGALTINGGCRVTLWGAQGNHAANDELVETVSYSLDASCFRTGDNTLAFTHTGTGAGYRVNSAEVSFTTGTPAPPPGPAPGKLIFSDDFNRFDATKWTVRPPRGGPWGSGDQVALNPANITVPGDGFLHGFIKREAFTVAGKTYPYTAGWAYTRDKFTFLYGRVEARAKLTNTIGTNAIPFWTIAWDGSGDEIDMMEIHGTRGVSSIRKNVNSVGDCGFQDLGFDPAKAFHVYAFDWTPKYVRWYIDGKQTCEVTKNIPAHAQALNIDTECGMPGWPRPLNSTSVLPQEQLVDYIRVHQL